MSGTPPAPGRVHRSSLLAMVAVTAAMVAWVVGPFAIAGTLRWWAGWTYLATLAPALLAHRTVVARRNPGLRAARRRIGVNTPRWDLVWNAAFWWLMAAVPMVAAAEHRLGHPALPTWTWAPGALLLGCGLGLSAAAMSVNPFFEGTVRLQAERGQRVVDAGPYARIRHPGYAGLCLWAMATPLLLRAPASAWVVGATVGWVVLRTVLEDRLLRRGLAGYEEYARRVRWRLVPGLW